MIAAYCWPQSASANDIVTLHCHADLPRVDVSVSRIGATEDQVLVLRGIATQEQHVPTNVAVEGCSWPVSAEIRIDPDWPSGYYLVRLIADGNEQAHAFFVVRAVEPHGALLALSTSTWAAYNNWGGPSYYTGGHTVSLDRPLPHGFLHKADPHRHRLAHIEAWTKADRENFRAEGNSSWSMAAGWANWEVLFARWAERSGYQFNYATSTDLDGNPNLLEGYRTYVSVGHDEYWTANMRNHVEAFVGHGGNAAFFSGNTSFWQARFEPDHKRLTCFKLAIEDDPAFNPESAPGLTTMWSDPLVGRPENLMTGVSFTRGGYAHMPRAPHGTGGYTIQQPDHWAFTGLGLTHADIVGAEPVVVGYECDGCVMTNTNGKLVPTGEDGTPETFEVLGTAPAHLWATEEGMPGLDDSYIGELNWVAERLGGGDTPEARARFADGHAVMGTFRRGRGEVFTTGCTDWAYGLGHADVDQVTKNVLDRFTNLRRSS